LTEWTTKSIPSVLKIPVIGQITNAMMAKKFAGIWYNYALPKHHPNRESFSSTATHALNNGGCFCLSSLVQGLKGDSDSLITLSEVSTTLIWGAKDYTHRKTDKDSIRDHAAECEIIEFGDCGHFPELENSSAFVRLITERVK